MKSNQNAIPQAAPSPQIPSLNNWGSYLAFGMPPVAISAIEMLFLSKKFSLMSLADRTAPLVKRRNNRG